ncbi:Alpha/Beta hydrolase protein [Microdochium trichocladiopsis]|uniref:Alpha/Beta hydrolase protein n=1 Tax=Microdochium trichocladiopsis TaxID=1682393 RepID=A0A9P8Y8S7_9PEZI|nr:Alpha/Beta hydrolase protein [Microdochium trichocladiopsis]KAH7033274.1 Alpha/Beta hydrolase protein [Microdochium trichocladiopsis]
MSIMAPAADAAVAPGGADAVKPYKIRVSSRYIDLTRQKLELARLPHEGLVAKSSSWWEPKAEVEALIDFWLEQYSWRAQEDAYNTQLDNTQFRTAFANPAADPDASAIRLHFIHVRSSQATAVPLLLIPPFPFTNISLAHLLESLVNPGVGGNASTQQAFHVVIPALPGLGFSDALPNNVPAISSTADLFNSLMLRLGYDHYLVTNTAPGSTSPAQIDHKLVDFLASCYSDHCVGAHLIAPPLAQPTLKQNPVEWAKWSMASVLRRDLFGYKTTDFLHKTRLWPISQAATPATAGSPLSLHSVGLREPNTLAYALCDSPTGLLVQVMKNLRIRGPRKEFTQTEVLNFTQLSWLPGPEAGLRYWASCSENPEEAKSTMGTKPRVTITVFQDTESSTSSSPEQAATDATALRNPALVPSYTCPAWANAKYHVLHTTRATGAPGLLAWERPEIIAEGARNLAGSVSRIDKRLLNAETGSSTAALAGVVVDGDHSTAASSSDGGRPAIASADATSSNNRTPQPPPLTQSPSGHLAPPATIAPADQRGQPQRELSDETMVSSSTELSDLSDKKLSIDERIQPSRHLSDETAVSGLSSTGNLSAITATGSGPVSPVPTKPSSAGSLPISPPVVDGADKGEAERKSNESAVPTAIVVTAADEDAAGTAPPTKAATVQS